MEDGQDGKDGLDRLFGSVVAVIAIFIAIAQSSWQLSSYSPSTKFFDTTTFCLKLLFLADVDQTKNWQSGGAAELKLRPQILSRLKDPISCSHLPASHPNVSIVFIELLVVSLLVPAQGIICEVIFTVAHLGILGGIVTLILFQGCFW